jgi:hypothetical protein
MTETTVRILGLSFDEVEKTVYEADLPFDLLVHGTRDGSVVCVTGEVDVLATVAMLGMNGIVKNYEGTR